MDQSKSTTNENDVIPKRTFTNEFFVGLFAVITLSAAGWMAIGLGGLDLFSVDHYQIFAEFDNISGLKEGASVEIAGVPIGLVNEIKLKDPEAIVGLKIRNEVKIKEDDIASIRTKGIIGDRYIKISRGISDFYIEPGQVIFETESVVDIEDIIGKLVHSLDSDE